MSHTMTMRGANAINRGGIAADFRAGLDFYVVWQDPKTGETHSTIHNNAHVSIPKMLADHGVTYEEALVERM